MQFLPIPGFSGYEINAAGEVKNIKTGNIVKPKSDDPKKVQIKADDGTSKRVNFSDVAKAVHKEPETPIIAETVVPKNNIKEPAFIVSCDVLTLQQKCYHLKHLNGYTHSQIKEALGLSIGQVNGFIYRVDNSPKTKAEYNTAIKNL